MDGRDLERALGNLSKKGLVRGKEGGFTLTENGTIEASRIVRVHRLWELYLNERMNIAPDHVHPDAEAIEHIITPELEKELLKELDYPELDPHRSVIPGIEQLKK